eukprot:4236757-Pyramimonas_sp.AAC.1
MRSPTTQALRAFAFLGTAAIATLPFWRAPRRGAGAAASGQKGKGDDKKAQRSTHGERNQPAAPRPTAGRPRPRAGSGHVRLLARPEQIEP